MRCDGLPALTLQRATTLSKAYCLFSTEASVSRGMPLCCGRCGWAGLVERGVVFISDNLAVFELLAPHVRGTIVCL